MSYAVDVNLLLYASDEASPFHDKAAAFLRTCASGSELLCIGWPTIVAYLRIATHPSIFASPLSPLAAMENVEALLRLPHVRPLAELDGFWESYRAITREIVPRGNLVPDAHLAAMLRQHGVGTLYTNDRDFRLFDFLELRNPLEA